MPKGSATVFGAEVIIDRIKVDIVAVGDGWSVTAQVILDQDDILFAHTVASPSASFEEATGLMAQQSVAATSAWLEEHK